MRTMRAWMLRLRGLFFRRRDEQEFLEQIQSDIDLHTEDGIRSGLAPGEARRAAMVKFGGVDSATEAWRDRRGIPFLETILRDVAHTFRVLGRNKGWAAVFILSLALGIGANTALYSAANGLLLLKLSVPVPDELVTLRWHGRNNVISGLTEHGFVAGSAMGTWFSGATPEFSLDTLGAGASGSYPTFRRLSAANQTLERMFALGPGPTVNFIVDGKGDTADTQFVSGEFYSTLKAEPEMGRLLSPADDQKGAAPVVVLSYAYWQRRFGGDANIVGKQVRINALACTVVGVSRTRFLDFFNGNTDTRDLSIPLANEPLLLREESRLDKATEWWLVTMGRLKPGVTPAQVQANLSAPYEQAGRDAWQALFATLKPEEQKDVPPGWGTSIPKLNVVPGARGPYDPLPFQKTLLGVLSILVAVVLVIIAANLANLSLAFTTSRHREIAVRQAIGGSRRRVLQQILTEHWVVALIGGAASLIFAYLSQDLIGAYLPIAFDWTAIVFAFVAATATGVLIGILPAWRAARVSGGSLAVGGAERRSRLATGLLVSQVALSLALLVGAGLFLRTLINLKNVDPGIDIDRLVEFTMEPSFSQYDKLRTGLLYRELVTNLRALPGVSSVGFSSQPLLSTLGDFGKFRSDRAAPGSPPVQSRQFAVSEDFFKATGIRLRAGRLFADHDNAQAPSVAVVNEAFARAVFGNANPIGQRFAADGSDYKVEVIGVVANAWHTSFRTAQPLAFYRPDLQSETGARTFAVRTALAPESLIPAIRQVIQKTDPLLPIINLSPLSSATGQQWFQERMFALASGALSALAVMVSMIGLFGLMSYAVIRRTKEIAIRMALGAERGGMLRSILREYLRLVGIGALIGLGIALGSGRFLKAMLFGLAPNDPLVIGGAIALMFIVAGLAAYTPARRASRIDPMVSLRHE